MQKAGAGGCWKVRQWEGGLIPKPENCGAGYFWNFLSPFPFIHRPWPQKYTSVRDKNSLTKPVQTSNSSPNHFRLSPCVSTQDSVLPALEPPWGTGPALAEPRFTLKAWQSPISLTWLEGSWGFQPRVHVRNHSSPDLSLSLDCSFLVSVNLHRFCSVQSLRRVRLFVTPWTAARQPPCPSPTPKSTQTHVHGVGDAIQPSHPLSSPSPPTFDLSHRQGLFQWVSSSHQVAITSNHWPHLRLPSRGPKWMTGYFSLTKNGVWKCLLLLMPGGWRDAQQDPHSSRYRVSKSLSFWVSGAWPDCPCPPAKLAAHPRPILVRSVAEGRAPFLLTPLVLAVATGNRSERPTTPSSFCCSVSFP